MNAHSHYIHVRRSRRSRTMRLIAELTDWHNYVVPIIILFFCVAIALARGS